MIDNVRRRGSNCGTMRKPRAFRRDAYFGFRLPDEEKRRLFEAGRKMRRDPSSLMLEFTLNGLAQLESRIRQQPQLSGAQQ